MAIDIATVKQAQSEQNVLIADRLAEVLKAKDELYSIGGTDDYQISLRQIVSAFPNGIALAKIQSVLTDSKSLGEARKALKDSGELEEAPKGKSFILKPVTKTAAE